jgi:hypothetical protein
VASYRSLIISRLFVTGPWKLHARALKQTHEDSHNLRKFTLNKQISTEPARCLTSSFVGLGFLVTLIGLPTTKYKGFWNGTGPLQTIVGRSFTAHQTHSETKSSISMLAPRKKSSGKNDPKC